MYLPESERLSIQSLSRVFSDMSESYKIFWFSGVLDVIKSGRASATFDEIINHMITDAWYMVSVFRIISAVTLGWNLNYAIFGKI